MELITEYINKNYKILYKASKNITNNNELADDLLHNVIEQIYVKQITLNNYEDEKIKSFIIYMLNVNWKSKTSRFHYQVRKKLKNYDDNIIKDIIPMDYYINNISDIDDNLIKDKEMLYTIIENTFLNLDYVNKIIFELYLTHKKLKKISKITNVSVPDLSRYIKTIKLQLKTDIQKQYYEYINN
jgi:hypothetical protein